jgi:uncharacterized phage protein (predicted DNA packaging)
MRNNLIALDEMKQHLNIDKCYDVDDQYIINLLYAAVDATEKHLRRKLMEVESPSILQGIKFLVAHWYINRENVSTFGANDIPFTFKYLMDLNRSYKKTY